MTFAASTLSPRTLRQAMATGHRYSAPEAVAADIVDQAVALDDLLSTAIELGRPLAGTAGANLASIKRDLFPAVTAQADSVD